MISRMFSSVIMVLLYEEAVRHHGIEEVTLVEVVLGEVIYCDLDRGWVVGHEN